MSELSNIPLPFKLLLAAVALAAVVGLLTALFKTVSRPPYETRQFLSPAELLFFRTLQEAIDGEFLLFAKVRVGDLLSVVEGTKMLIESEPGRHRLAGLGRRDVQCVCQTL